MIDLPDLYPEILARGHGFRIQGQGNSMLPLIHDGDTLRIEPANPPVRAGDILLFRNAQRRLIVHRVIRVTSRQDGVFYLMNGDHSNHSDGWIDATQVIGRASGVEQNGSLTSFPVNMKWYFILRGIILFYLRRKV